MISPFFTLLPLSSIFFHALASPSSVIKRSSTAPILETIYQAPNIGSWLENLAVRPNGQILTTRFDVAELWLVDPTSKTASKVYTWPDGNGFAGITQIRNDVYAVAAMTINLIAAVVTPKSASILKVDMTGESPVVSVLAAIPNISFPNGLTTWDEETILIADSLQGVIYSMDTTTGAYSVAIKDASMLPAPGKPIGVNGVKRFGEYVYYTSSTQELFARVSVSRSYSTTITAKGPIEILASGVFMDDFIINRMDGTAFIAGNVNDELFELSRGGALSVFAGAPTSLEVAGCTSVEFGEYGSVMYVATGGGLAAPVNGTVVEPAKIVAFRLDGQ